MSAPRYAAIIRTFNSAKTLKKVLRSLRIQSRPPNEIVIVDSGSTDLTLTIAKHFGAKIVYYPREAFNYSKAINLGVAAVSSEFALIISSHTVLLSKEVSGLMLSSFEDPIIFGVYCTPFIDPKMRPKDISKRRISLETFNGYNGLWNTCSMIRTADWISIPFSEAIPAAEDQFWALTWFRNGRQSIRLEDPNVLNLNPHRSRWKDARDSVIIARFCVPERYTWISVLRQLWATITHLRRRSPENMKSDFLTCMTLTASKLGLIKIQSTYADGPPLLLRWLR